MMRLCRHAPAPLLLLLLLGCAATRPSAAPPSGCGEEPAEVLACARAREEAIRSLRARFTAEAERQARRYSVQGALLVAKPDRFRLRLMLPFGMTVFDCTLDGDEMHTSLPLQGDAPRGGAAAPLPFAQVDFEEAFLRGPHAFPGACGAEDGGAGTTLVHCVDGASPRRRELRLDRTSATIIEETSYVDDQPRLTLRYGDYRLTAGVLLPWAIALSDPGRGVVLRIDIDRYEVNPALAPRLFEPMAR